jgi:hypothetical protein
MTEYKRIDESIYLQFGKKLSQEGKKKKILNSQIEFLQACRNGKKDFLNYLDEKLLNDKCAIIEGDNILFNHQFTEAEFRFPPIDTQKIIWNTFKDIPRQNMGFCGFWGHVVIQMIKCNCITPDYLASELNGVHKTGIYMLDSAINSDDGKEIDKSVRRILRSMGCPPAGRGKRMIFNDFYLGKAYWRWNWANRVSNEISLSFEEILKTLDEKGYSEFSARMHSKRSYISQINTLSGLLLFLKENPETLVKNIKKIINMLGYLSIWKAIEIQSPEINRQEIKIIADGL